MPGTPLHAAAANGVNGANPLVAAGANGLKHTVGRYAFDLPYHPDDTERLALGILALFARLERLESLEPNPQNSKLFNQLFDLVTTTKTTVEQDSKILSDPRIVPLIPRLWTLWGDAEYLLEADFARKVINAPAKTTALKTFNSFPYLDQYRQLARMEVNTLDTALGELSLPPIRRIAFIGSGPTPFTSLCYAERYSDDVSYHNIDRNPDAIALSSSLVTSCGFKNVSFEQIDADSLTDLREFDVVHFAAMVGADADAKKDLLVGVAKCMRPGALILLRSTDSLRTVLYPRYEVDDTEVLSLVTPVVATRYYGGATSLTAIVVKVD
ncbi:nicotianamine synthase [Pseudovirgaria hyperparasitica]|uniref:Nicotianamine synthase n=1 Tax=Pseudovirgaria hyperparasitica TaxID=470096 RepID=A0A6A6W2Y5_9PEZI|nr:nicotianamine synthase [Pseudovirgaria hyperparasitica]KAF2756489.1 nicotianamine synthase [Pseudovirgaria hyperparasitica]